MISFAARDLRGARLRTSVATTAKLGLGAMAVIAEIGVIAENGLMAAIERAPGPLDITNPGKALVL